MAELCFSQTCVSKLRLKLRVSCLGALYIFPPALSKSIDRVFVYANISVQL